MTPELWTEISELMEALEETQAQLAAVYQAKRAAIRRADASELDELTVREQELVSRLQALSLRRERILQAAKSRGQAADSLEDLVRDSSDPGRVELLQRIARTQRAADSNRRQSWILWVISQHSLRLFDEMIELIGNRGSKAPVYAERPELRFSTGGAILDASA